LNPDKRDGSIVKCILDAEQNLIVDDILIQKSCVDILEQLSSKFEASELKELSKK
jgi:hypothetical protein